MHEKAKFVSFIYVQPQKVKFKSVQINRSHTFTMEANIMNPDQSDMGPYLLQYRLPKYIRPDF